MSVNATVDSKAEGCVDNISFSKNESIKFLDLIRPTALNNDEAASIVFFLNPKFTEEINQFAHQQKCNQQTILISAWMYVLGFYANTDAISIDLKCSLPTEENMEMRQPKVS